MKSLAQISQEITQNHDWNQAEHDLQVGLQAHPESAKGWYYYAQVELHQGKLVNAKDALAKADAIDPSHTYAGSLAKYNAFVGKLESQTVTSHASTTMLPRPSAKTAMFTSQPIQHQQNISLAPYYFGGIVIILAVCLLVKLFKRPQQTTFSRPSSDAYDSVDTNIQSKPYSHSSIPPSLQAVSYPQQTYPQQSYGSNTPTIQQSNSGSGMGGIVSGVIGGVLLDEAVSGLMHRDRGNNDSNNNNTGFDLGSQTIVSPSQDDNFDAGSQNNDSPTFDTGSNVDTGSSDFGSSDSSSSDSGGNSDW